MVDIAKWREGVYADKGDEKDAAKGIFLINERSDKAVLMIHGYRGYPGEMQSLAELYSKEGFSVFVPRLPGMGTTREDFRRSDWADWLDYSMAAYKDIMENYGNVILLGHSMGVFISLILAAKFSPRSLILIAPPFSTSSGLGIDELVSLSTDGYEKKIPWHSDKRFRLHYPGAPKDDEALGNEYWSYFQARNFLSFEILKKMAKLRMSDVKCRCAVFYSPVDPVAPSDNIEEDFSMLENKEFFVLEGGTHEPMYDISEDVEEELKEKMLSFSLSGNEQ